MTPKQTVLEEELNPLVSLTVKILKFFAYIQVDSWRRYGFSAVGITITSSLIVQLLIANIPITEIIQNMYITVLWFTTVMRALVLMKNRKNIAILLARAHELYIEILHNGTHEMKDTLAATTKSARFFGGVNLVLGLISCIGFNLTPFFTEKRRLVYDMYIPLYNDRKYETPFYEAIWIFQMIVTPVGCCMFIPYTNLFVAFVRFAICMCLSLQAQLRAISIGVNTERIVIPKLLACVKYHWEIISFVNAINEISTYVFLVEYITFGALLCALMFLLNTAQTPIETLFVVGYSVMIVVQLGAVYWYASSLYNESLGIADAAYDVKWYKFNGQVRLILRMIIMRSQKPCALTMADAYPISMGLLKNLLNLTYSYFTLLRRMYNN